MYLLQPALSYHRFQMVTIISSLPQQNMVEIRPGGSPEGRLGSMKIPKNEVVVLPWMDSFWKWLSELFIRSNYANFWEVFSVKTRPTWGLPGTMWSTLGKLMAPRKTTQETAEYALGCAADSLMFQFHLCLGGWSPIEPSKLPLLSIVHWSGIGDQ